MPQTLLGERSERQYREKGRAGPWLRLRVFLSRLRFDRALSRGADPHASPELALRAEQLRRPKVRERIAKGIDHLVDLAFADPRRPLSPSMLPLRQQRVRPNLELLEELAGALRAPGPHSVQGLAMASALVEDAYGPLYASEPDESLREALDATISELDAEN